MLKTSGLILDVYDDRAGAVMHKLYPNRGQIPEVIKTAHLLTETELSELPDDVFALVIQDGDTRLRKLACVDAGNTLLSIQYFLSTGHKLSNEAQKLAASNLLTACSWYGISPSEELEKVAVLGLIGPVLTAAATLPGAVKETKAQLAVNKGPMVITPEQRLRNMQLAGFSG